MVVFPAARTSMLLFLCLQRRRRSPLEWNSFPTVSLSRLLSSSSSNSHYDDYYDKNNNRITSTKSNTIKTLQALLTKRKKRVEMGETIVEGPRIVNDLLANSRTRPLIRQIVISEDKWDEYLPQLLRSCSCSSRGTLVEDDQGVAGKTSNLPLILAATPDVLQSCTDTVTNQGIVARVTIPTTTLNLQNSNNNNHKYPLYLVSDRVSDPGNLGTLIRSSVATGVSALILLPHSCDIWSPKAIRSAMGATFLLPTVSTNSWHECAELLQKWGCRRVYAATMLEEEEEGDDGQEQERQANKSPNTSKDTSHYQVDWTDEPTALVIGGEGNGLSHDVRQAMTKRIRTPESIKTTGGDEVVVVQSVYVPMQPGVESLNAGVCGSVILFEYLRQRLAKEKYDDDEDD